MCEKPFALADGVITASTPLILVEGGRTQRERQFQRLISEPHTFEHDEFERLIESFDDRLSRAEIYDLTTERLLRFEGGNTLEQRAVLAAATGDLAEARRLRKVLERRNALQLRVIGP